TSKSRRSGGLRLLWPRILYTVGRLIPFCKAVVANVCRSTCGLTFLVSPARLATALTMSWARRVLTGNGPYRGSETWQREGRKHPRVMISRDCGDDGLNCLESCLPLDSNIASNQPDEAVQRVGGLSSGKSRFRKGGCQGAGISDEGCARHSGVCRRGEPQASSGVRHPRSANGYHRCEDARRQRPPDSASKGHRVCCSTGFRLAGET